VYGYANLLEVLKDPDHEDYEEMREWLGDDFDPNTVKILEYTGLDTSRVKASYRKVADAIARNDFRAAQVKKLVNLSHGKFYRARLDDADRLLFSLVRHGDEVCALMLEVIANHDYDKSRFLRGAAIDESRIPTSTPTTAIAEAQPVRYLHPERTAIHLLDKPISFDDTQEAIYRQPAPLIVVGSAGSGKTALTLENSSTPKARCSTSRTPATSRRVPAISITPTASSTRAGGRFPLLPRVRRVDPRAAGPRGELARLRRLVRTHAADVPGVRRPSGLRRDSRRARGRRRRRPLAR
jgi:hypothetical protein